MSSFARNLQRKAMRKSPSYEPRAQYVEMRGDGGYLTLRPTKGWALISAKRLQAQQWMAALLDHVVPARPRKPARTYRKAAPPAPSNDSRQQRRQRARRAGAE